MIGVDWTDDFASGQFQREVKRQSNGVLKMTTINNIASNEIVAISTGVDGALSCPVYGYEVMFDEAHTRALANGKIRAEFHALVLAQTGVKMPNPAKVKQAKKKVRQTTKSRAQRAREVRAELARIARPKERAELKRKRKACYKGLTARQAELVASLALPGLHPEIAGLLREELAIVVGQLAPLAAKLRIKAK